jgi:hypothetical protein
LRPSISQLPFELLTAIFRHLPAKSLAAAIRVNRFWRDVGVTLIWRQPPENALKKLSNKRRWVYAPYILELKLSTVAPTATLYMTLAHLRTLHVLLRLVREETGLFCRFLRRCGVGDNSSGAVTGGTSACCTTTTTTGFPTAGSQSKSGNNTATSYTSTLRSLTIALGWGREVPIRVVKRSGF